LAEVWQETLSHFGRGLGVSILYGLALVFAMLLLLIPGIYLAILWSLAIPLIVFENLGVGALSRSSQLLKGNWWRTFAMLLVAGIITALISGAFSLPLIILTGVKTYFAAAEEQLVDTLGSYGILNILASIIAFFGTIVSYVILASVTAFYMGTLVEEQESRGLMAEINADPASEKSAADSNEQY
jgi:membrane-anchored glycerophosphoryl diester phosphodiesterase (GDPDase)